MRGSNVDWLGLCVRFVCGAVFGAIAGYFVATANTAWPVMPVFLVTAGGCGVLAAVLGDAFWRALGEGWR
jgi:hypothetical protein